MQLIDGEIVLSASDLTGHLACEHLTQLELAAARGLVPRPQRHDPELEVVSARGIEHERAYLERLRDEGREVVEITGDHRSLTGLRQAAADTESAMRAGAELIYQGTFFDGRWLGHADFLRRVDMPTGLGPFGYEVLDTKLARRVKAAALLQIAAYSAQLATVQGVAPEHMHVVLGDLSEESYLVREFAAYHRMLRRRLDEAVTGEPLVTYPDPVEHCGVCRWADVCDTRRRADDHLSLVAGVRRDQTRKLAAAGIETVAALARTDVDDRVPGVSAPILERLTHPADPQLRQRTTGERDNKPL